MIKDVVNHPAYQYVDEILLIYDKCGSYRETAKIFLENHPEKAASPDSFRRVVQAIVQHERVDAEVLGEASKQAKSKQKFQDINRIERKVWREDTRVSNALEDYNLALIELLKSYRMNLKIHEHDVKEGSPEGIFHFTDAHFNELVNQSDNRYDFEIASKRCRKLADHAIKIFNLYGVKNVLFADTGDNMNSDRRLDELLNQATNRSKATFLAVEIKLQMLLHLNKHFNLRVACTSGNESRMKKDVEWSEMVLTDNYDFTIHNIIKNMLDFASNYSGKSFGIRFIEGDWAEKVVQVGNKNILLLHGNSKNCESEKGLQSIKGKYASRGITIDFILMGHIHSAWISDMFARGASLVGDNAYSAQGLQLTGRASQNIHVIDENDIHSFKIDLQDTSNIAGYGIHKALEAYNPKSASKLRPHKTIFEVIV